MYIYIEYKVNKRVRQQSPRCMVVTEFAGECLKSEPNPTVEPHMLTLAIYIKEI
jgi:hypothetical protein